MSNSAVQDHYTFQGIRERLEAVLQDLAANGKPLTWKDLVPLDQFHAGGFEGTQRLVEALQIGPGDRALDVGSGLGGPARFAAATYGCEVTGIELTPIFVEIANYLTERTNLTRHVSFVQGDALDMPFEDEAFNHAWTQHVAMNIQDKETFYKSISRVLKKGGRFGMFDVVLGTNEPVEYPVPWAYDASISFVASVPQMRALLEKAGFAIESTYDATNWGIAWLEDVQAKQKMLSEPPKASVPALMGEDSRPAFASFLKNLQQNRLGLVQLIARKE